MCEVCVNQIQLHMPRASVIDCHNLSCCHSILAWFRGIDTAESYRDGRWHPPMWLREHFEWGPMQRPVHWCALPSFSKLDCGALAALVVQIYRSRGQVAYPVQLALRYPRHALAQWSCMWEREGLSAGWVGAKSCYHEACGILEGGNLRVWDPTENRWLSPPTSAAELYGAIEAMKLDVAPSQSFPISWYGIPFHAGSWCTLPFVGRDGAAPESSSKPSTSIGGSPDPAVESARQEGAR